MRQDTPIRFANVSWTWGIIYLCLFAYRTSVSVFGESVIRRVTSIGDTGTYQSGVVTSGYQHTAALLREDLLFALSDLHGGGISTILTIYVGGVFNKLLFGNPFLINIGFQSITYIGLIYLLQSVAPTVRLRLLILMMLPSFTVWTSIASKEAIVAGAVAILAAYFIRMYNGQLSPRLHHIIAALILFLFKPHYGAAFAYGIGSTFICFYARKKALTALVIGIASLCGLFIFKDFFVRFAFLVQNAFLVEIVEGSEAWGTRSTRTEVFFVEDFDLFLKAPEGIIRAFFGPSISEITTSTLHLVTFLEGAVLAGVLFYFVLRVLLKLPIYNVVVTFFMSFWILFPNYPFGVMNSGAAIRYRSGWILVFIVLIAVFLSRNIYANWVNVLSTSRDRKSAKAKTSSHDPAVTSEPA